MANKNKALGSGLETRVVDRARAKGLSARRQPGSGVFTEYPNDVVVEGFLGECKVRSTHPSLAQMLDWLGTTEFHAEAAGYRGAFLVYNQKGSRTPVVLLDLDLFLSLLAEFRDRT